MTSPIPVILLIEDEELFAKAVKKRLDKAGYCGLIANDLHSARLALQSQTPELMLLDMRLPDGNGLDFLEELKKTGSSVPVLVMSAFGELEDAVAAMKLQALDYLKKPIDLDELVLYINNCISNNKLSEALAHSQKREEHLLESFVCIGDSPEFRTVRAQANQIARLCTDKTVLPPTVLILGETGTGKDVMARYLHHLSVRKGRPFVHVDCAALPRELIEAELFGHEKGAYTNAVTARIGLIEAAEDGILFLDEIGELPLELQSKLLAVLERRVLRRIGSTIEKPINAWILAATNRDPDAMVKSGQLRADLYFRLNVVTLSLPALRLRGEDIVLLANYFAEQSARRYGFSVPQFTKQAQKLLINYSWPGNIRELKHCIERCVLFTSGGEISDKLLFLPEIPRDSEQSYENLLDDITLEEAERLLILKALKKTDNNVSEAARLLGVTRMTLRYRLKKYQILL